jgi:hypothetical protein
MTNEAMTNETWDVRMDGDMVIAGSSERTRLLSFNAYRSSLFQHRCCGF